MTRRTERHAALGLGALFGLSLLGCGDESAQASDVTARIDARLAELRGDEDAMRAALSPLPAIERECEVPSDAVGPAITGAGAEVPSARVEGFTEQTRELRERAATISAAGAERWLGRYAGEDWQRHELVIVATAYEAPSLSQATYDPGSVEGRAVLWDHVEGRVLCARDVRVVPDGDEAVEVRAGSGGDAAGSREGAVRVLDRRLVEAARVQSLAAMRREPEEPAATADPVPADDDPGESI